MEKRSGMGDFEQWDQGPKHAAPNRPSPDFQEQIRAEKIRVLVKLLCATAILILGIMAFFGWRPW